MITCIRAHELLRANFRTGELFWIYNHQRPDLIGKRAGHINNGYWRLSIDGQEYYACQIIWLMYYGRWCDRTIDHEDRE